MQPDFPDIDASLAQALCACGALPPEELARRAAAHADLRDRVGKLRAIAAAADGHCSTA
jgi:hypothetical protein